MCLENARLTNLEFMGVPRNGIRLFRFRSLDNTICDIFQFDRTEFEHVRLIKTGPLQQAESARQSSIPSLWRPIF